MKLFRLTLPLVLLLAAACGLNNTMYNARKYFKAAQERPLNANGRPNNQAVQEYTKAIQKCGIILSRKNRSRITDDALFLMARALYYKGNSAFQAKDQFEALIKGFADSRFYGESHIYLARVYREINRPDDARRLLEQFILDPDQFDLHPRALLTLAEFDIADLDYAKAQFWLQRIIDNYPKSREFREAYSLFGKNYYIQKDYQASLREYEKIAENRLIPKLQRLEALYYVALNQFQLGAYNDSWKNVQRLLNDEARPEQLSRIRVLKARLQFARGDLEGGVAEIGDISKSYPRTQSSAEAKYYLGEHYFLQAHDPDQAAAAYNAVRVEFPGSELAEPAQRKAAAIAQLKTNTGLDPLVNLQQFVDYHITAAENYLNSFALPDSALSMYQRVIDYRDSLQAWHSELSVRIAAQQATVDSLEAELALLPPAPAPMPEIPYLPEAQVHDGTVGPDSLAGEAPDFVTEPDSLDLLEIPEQSESLVTDSLAVAAAADSLDLPEQETPPGEDTRRNELEQQLSNLQAQLDADIVRQTQIGDLLPGYDSEILPLALFSQASIHSHAGLDNVDLLAIHQRMLAEFPGNKYTNALTDMLNGETVRLIDPVEEAQEKRLDQALGLYETEPDSMLVLLTELKDSDFSGIRLRSNFRLGWFYTFQRPDTTQAKAYLDETLKLQPSGEYADLIGRFYTGDRFRLNTFDALVDSLAAVDAADSLSAPADSLPAELEPPETEELPDPELETPAPEPAPETHMEQPEKKEEILIEPEAIPLPPVETEPGESTPPPDTESQTTQ